MRRLLVTAVAVGLALLPGAAWAQSDGDQGELTLVHGLRDFLADVYLDGQLVLEGFTPERVTDAIPVPAGEHLVELRAARAEPTSEPALSGELTVGAGEALTVVAHLGPEGEPTLSWFTNDLSPVPAGEGRLALRNVADSGPVSLVAGEQPLVQDVASGNQGEATLAAQPQQLLVQGEDAMTLAQAADLEIAAGTFTAVYLIGSQSQDSLGLLTQRLQSSQQPPGAIESGSGGDAARGGSPPGVPVSVLVAVFVVVVGALGVARRRR